MNPTIGDVGGLAIQSYGFHFLLSCVLTTVVIAVLLRLRGQNMAPAVDLTLLLIVSQVLVARAFHALLAGDLGFFESPAPGTFQSRFWGGQLAFALLGGLYLLWTRAPFGPLADSLAVASAFAWTLHKIGCFMAGCCYGSPTSVPWAVVFPGNGMCRLSGVPIHPTQLYDAVGTFLIGGILLRAYLRRQGEGRLVLWWGLLYAVLKYATEWTRGDRIFVLKGPMTAAMLVELATAAGCALLLSRPAAWNFLLALRELRTAAAQVPEGSVKRNHAFAMTLGNAIVAVVVAGAVLVATGRVGDRAALPALVGYYVVASLLSGINPVFRVLGLRVVDGSGRPASFVRLAIRGLVASLTLSSFFGLFRPLLDRWGRGLGDAFAGTWLVRRLPTPLPPEEPARRTV
jgi:phosphatidylglycerol:prolipoprotein diacylglycerol transferase